MGFLDLFKKQDTGASSERELARLTKLVSNKFSQNIDRQDALERLAQMRTPEAADVLLKRFSWTLDPTITDHEEKELAASGIAAVGTAAIEPLRRYCARAESLTWPLKALRRIVAIDDTALFDFAHPKLVSYQALCEAGGDADLAWLEAQVARVRPEQPAFIVYTSGTTGHPKGALITHGKHLAATRSVAVQYPTLVEKQHRTVAYLPLCHVLGRDIAVTLPLLTALVPHIGESAQDLPETLFETAPTVLFTVPRYLQKLAAQVLVQANSSSALKRFAFDRAMAFGRRHVKRRWTGTASRRWLTSSVSKRLA